MSAIGPRARYLLSAYPAPGPRYLRRPFTWRPACARSWGPVVPCPKGGSTLKSRPGGPVSKSACLISDERTAVAVCEHAPSAECPRSRTRNRRLHYSSSTGGVWATAQSQRARVSVARRTGRAFESSERTSAVRMGARSLLHADQSSHITIVLTPAG